MLRTLRIEALEYRSRYYPPGWLDRLLARGAVKDGILTVDDALWRSALAENQDPAKAAANGEIIGGCGGCSG